MQFVFRIDARRDLYECTRLLHGGRWRCDVSRSTQHAHCVNNCKMQFCHLLATVNAIY